jgi:hypothetical protein
VELLAALRIGEDRGVGFGREAPAQHLMGCRAWQNPVCGYLSEEWNIAERDL